MSRIVARVSRACTTSPFGARNFRLAPSSSGSGGQAPSSGGSGGRAPSGGGTGQSGAGTGGATANIELPFDPMEGCRDYTSPGCAQCCSPFVYSDGVPCCSVSTEKDTTLEDACPEGCPPCAHCSDDYVGKLEEAANAPRPECDCDLGEFLCGGPWAERTASPNLNSLAECWVRSRSRSV